MENKPLKGKVSIELNELEVNLLLMAIDAAGIGTSFFKQMSKNVLVLPSPLGENNSYASDSFVGHLKGIQTTLTQALIKQSKKETGIISLDDAKIIH